MSAEHPTINDAKALALKYRKRGVIVLAFGQTTFAGASYGMTRRECGEMGNVLDQIIECIQNGTIELDRDLEREIQAVEADEKTAALLAACEAVLDRHNYQGTGEPWPSLLDRVKAAVARCRETPAS